MRAMTPPAAALGLMMALAACNQTAEEASPAPIAEVKTALVATGTSDNPVMLYGIAEPRAGAEAGLAVPVEASVDQIVAPNGTRVSAGAIIATLRLSAGSRLDLAKAQNDYAAAAAASERARRLRADGLVSDAEVENARSAAHSNALTLDSLTQRARHLTLRAPIAGTVQGLMAHAGDLVAPGTTLARIVASGRLRARFGIDPALARRAAPGMAVTISLGNGEGAIAARVMSVDRVVDPTTRLAGIIAALPDGHGASPGEALRAELNLGSGAVRPIIPYVALLDEGGQSYVFVIHKGLAHRRAVTAGAAYNESVTITTGLVVGERIALSGGTALEDGMKVRAR